MTTICVKLCRRCGTIAAPARAGGSAVSDNELFWIEVIRQASRDSDPGPTLKRVQKLRAIFRG